MELTIEQKLEIRSMQLQISQLSNAKFQLELQFRNVDGELKLNETKLKNRIDELKPEGNFVLSNDLTWEENK
jgi:uncharacterized protein (UPF0210 family)